MDAANRGSANASMRSTFVPRSTTSRTGLKNPIMKGAARYSMIPESVMTAIPNAVMIQPIFRVVFLCSVTVSGSERPAPILWPITAVAADAIPNPGI